MRHAVFTVEPTYLSSCAAARRLIARILGCTEADMPFPAGAHNAVVVLNKCAGQAAAKTATREHKGRRSYVGASERAHCVHGINP